MTYPLIINALREFELITEEQFLEAWHEYQKGLDEVDTRMDAYRDAWLEERENRPWWRRWFIMKSGWITDWYKQPIEVRYPPTEDEKRIQELMG